MMPSLRVNMSSESIGRARSVDELIFNQIADRFELAIELEIPNELRKL